MELDGQLPHCPDVGPEGVSSRITDTAVAGSIFQISYRALQFQHHCSAIDFAQGHIAAIVDEIRAHLVQHRLHVVLCQRQRTDDPRSLLCDLLKR